MLRNLGVRGRPHIQLDKIANRHIFYGIVGLFLGGLAASSVQAGEYSAEITEVYKDHYPGDSIANALTVTYWCGEDSAASLLDWVNPLELLALAGDIGRSLDREAFKELVGISITVSKNGKKVQTFSFDTSGELVSVGIWKGEDDVGVIPGDDYLKAMENNGIVDDAYEFLASLL